jgi:hypothetical protein
MPECPDYNIRTNALLNWKVPAGIIQTDIARSIYGGNTDLLECSFSYFYMNIAGLIAG